MEWEYSRDIIPLRRSFCDNNLVTYFYSNILKVIYVSYMFMFLIIFVIFKFLSCIFMNYNYKIYELKF